MQIDFDYDSSVASAPAGFITALTYAASVLDSLITNPITVTIEVGWGEVGGQALPADDLGEGGPTFGTTMSYSQLVANMQANALTPAAQQETGALAGTTSQELSAYDVSTAQEKAWGLLPPDASGVDGEVGFAVSSDYAFAPDDQAVAGEYGFIGIAEHEITHALGRITSDGALELADYSAPGVLNTSAGGGYFSVNGGVTSLGALATGDPADWVASNNGDAFNYDQVKGIPGTITPADDTVLAELGFDEGSNPPTYFDVEDTNTGVASYQNGTPYAGPVAGLSNELIMATSYNVNVTSYTPNTFIHTAGTGMDSINVAAAGGANILDGSTGSDFLTGGSGNDIFYLDDRDPATDIWSSIANFHSGDHVTVWGVTTAGFTLTWLNGQGAAGYTGLTGVFQTAGMPEAAVTLAGFTTADLSNGRLSITYGSTPNEPGLPGSPFMNITAA